MTAKVRANMAGNWKGVKSANDSALDFPRMEKRAPMEGPNMNPRENATPIKACQDKNTIS